jgi:hypothetical protein
VAVSLSVANDAASLPIALPRAAFDRRIATGGRAAPRPEEGLLIEWPGGEPEPRKYFLATLPASSSRKALVGLAKSRWRVERDDRELKQELGLGHDEGRGWRGFHHHAALAIALLLAALLPQGPCRRRSIAHPTASARRIS